jgi:pyrimidine-nucleoside phosphorylase
LGAVHDGDPPDTDPEVSFVEAIIRKRDGSALDRSQIRAFVSGATDGSLPPEQLAAMLMAICWRGMDDQETHWLTEEMLQSGEVWQLATDRPDAVDKHSTGGVGDTVSLVFAPLLAACNVPVAMMAGRGLGHSQGTLDKLAAIPGFRTQWSRAEVLRLIDTCGVAFMAQSERVAPADGALYALRDITGTVPSLPLMVASIMSKKLAMGVGNLVLDVKWGRGAFRSTVKSALELAASLRAVARDMGVAAEAVLTDMNQPLGPALGTACEVRAARDVLGGGGGDDLREVTLRLAQQAMASRGRPADRAREDLESAISDGRALAAWDSLVLAHGGDPDPDRLTSPRRTATVSAADAGWLVGVAADRLGRVAAELGAGRSHREQALAHGGGIVVHSRLGDRVESGQPLAEILVGEREVDLDALVTRVASAFEIGPERVEPPRLVLGTVDEVFEEGAGNREQGPETSD